MQHRQITVIGKGDFIHHNAAFDLLERLGIGAVLHRRLCGHHIHKPPQSGKAVGKHFREVAELAHGVDEGGNVQIKGNQIPVIHFSLHHIVAAEADDHHIQTAQEKFHAAVEHTHGLVELPFGSFVNLIGRIEPAALNILIAEGLGRADAGETALNFLVDMSGLFLGGNGGNTHPAAHGHDHHQKNRNHQRHHHRQLPANGGHYRQGAADGQK